MIIWVLMELYYGSYDRCEEPQEEVGNSKRHFNALIQIISVRAQRHLALPRLHEDTRPIP